MKKTFYLLPFLLLGLFSFKSVDRGTVNLPKVVLTGCFTNRDVYVEVDYSTGPSTIIQVRAYSPTYPYTQYTVTGYPFDEAYYAAGHVHVEGLTVLYTIPGYGSGYTYPLSTTLGNDCGL